MTAALGDMEIIGNLDKFCVSDVGEHVWKSRCRGLSGLSENGTQRSGTGNMGNSRSSAETRLEEKGRVTGRTGRFLRTEDAERGKEEETDGAERGDSYRSEVLEKAGGSGIWNKNGGVASEGTGTFHSLKRRSQEGVQVRVGR